MSGGGGGGGGGIGGVSGPDGSGGVGGGPADIPQYRTSLTAPAPTGVETKKKKKAADEKAADEKAAADKKAADEKKAADRKSRSLLTGYEDPHIARRRLLRTEDGGTFGQNTSQQLS